MICEPLKCAQQKKSEYVNKLTFSCQTVRFCWITNAAPCRLEILLFRYCLARYESTPRYTISRWALQNLYIIFKNSFCFQIFQKMHYFEWKIRFFYPSVPRFNKIAVLKSPMNFIFCPTLEDFVLYIVGSIYHFSFFVFVSWSELTNYSWDCY